MYSNKFKLALIFTFLISIVIFAAQPDAEYLEMVDQYELTESGEIIHKHQHRIKLNTFFTTNSIFPDQSVIYNPKYQELEIENASTIMKNGEENVTPPRGYNEVMIDGATGAPQYTHLRRMVVSHTGVERGCTLKFSYNITSDKDFLPGLMEEEVIGARVPIKKKVVKVIIPSNEKLNYKLFNSNVKPEEKIEDEHKIYTWVFRNIAAIPREEETPDYRRFAPYLVLSTINSWENIYDWLASDLSSKLKINTGIREYTQQKLAEIQDKRDRVFQIHEIVTEELGNANFDPALTGYRIKNSTETWNHNTGNPLDKAFLMAALLEEFDIQAQPVIIGYDAPFTREVPGLMQFKNVAVSFNCGAGNEFLSLSNQQKQNYAFDMAGKYYLPVGKEYQTLQIAKAPGKDNGQNLEIELNIDKDFNVSGKGIYCCRGYFNPYYQLYRNDDFKNIVSPKLGDQKVGALDIKTISTEKSKCSYTIEEEKLEAKEGYLRIPLPDLNNQLLNANYGKVNRNNPLKIQTGFKDRIKVAFKIPQAFKYILPEVAKQIENEAGTLLITFQQNDNKLKVVRELELKTDYISPELYPDFRKLMEEWNNKLYQEIVIKTE